MPKLKPDMGRVDVLLSNVELGMVDDWRRLQKEIPCRSHAIRTLVKLALKHAKIEVKAP